MGARPSSEKTSTWGCTTSLPRLEGLGWTQSECQRLGSCKGYDGSHQKKTFPLFYICTCRQCSLKLGLDGKRRRRGRRDFRNRFLLVSNQHEVSMKPSLQPSCLGCFLLYLGSVPSFSCFSRFLAIITHRYDDSTSGLQLGPWPCGLDTARMLERDNPCPTVRNQNWWELRLSLILHSSCTAYTFNTQISAIYKVRSAA